MRKQKVHEMIDKAAVYWSVQVLYANIENAVLFMVEKCYYLMSLSRLSSLCLKVQGNL